MFVGRRCPNVQKPILFRAQHVTLRPNYGSIRHRDSAHGIREYFIPDFSNWKDHDSYQSAFDRLLNDLKAEAEAAGR